MTRVCISAVQAMEKLGVCSFVIFLFFWMLTLLSFIGLGAFRCWLGFCFVLFLRKNLMLGGCGVGEDLGRGRT